MIRLIRLIRSPFLPCLLASIPAAAVEAGFVTYSFSGTVTLVTQPSPYGIPVVTGQAVSGAFAYDPSSPDLAPGPNFGQYAGVSPPGFGADLYLQFRDSTATAFPSDALPPATLTIADFDSAIGLLLDVGTGDQIQFQITSLTGVPAPGALALAVSAPLASRRRRRPA